MTRNFTDIMVGKIKIAQRQNPVILFISSESSFHDVQNAFKRNLKDPRMTLNNEIFYFPALQTKA